MVKIKGCYVPDIKTTASKQFPTKFQRANVPLVVEILRAIRPVLCPTNRQIRPT